MAIRMPMKPSQPNQSTLEPTSTFCRTLHGWRKSKGWKKTGFQVYFNNKGSLTDQSKAPWILDEPSGYWDYRALQYYGELTDRGREAAPQVKIDYRIDISRPEYCRGQLSHRSDLWIVSSWAFQHYRRLVTDRIELDGSEGLGLWNIQSCP